MQSIENPAKEQGVQDKFIIAPEEVLSIDADNVILSTVVRTLIHGVRSLLFPASCAGCAHPVLEETDSPLCPDCARQLPRATPPWCRVCGLSLANLGAGIDLCLGCKNLPHAFDRAISPLRYEGVAKNLVLNLKYQGRLSLAPFLAHGMKQAVLERLGPDPADAVVPVPLHPTRLRERTFNQARALARQLARELHLPCWDQQLIRQKATRSQAELPRKERLANVEGAFGVRPDPKIRLARILLVDDVFTTGATVDACAKALKGAGASRVIVVTVAHG